MLTLIYASPLFLPLSLSLSLSLSLPRSVPFFAAIASGFDHRTRTRLVTVTRNRYVIVIGYANVT